MFRFSRASEEHEGLMVLRDPADFHPHLQGDGAFQLIGRDSRQYDTHHLDGVLLCSASMHPLGLGTGCGSWSLDQTAMAVV